jgi:hypothetical protein
MGAQGEDKFALDASRKAGRDKYCKECRAALARARRASYKQGKASSQEGEILPLPAKLVPPPSRGPVVLVVEPSDLRFYPLPEDMEGWAFKTDLPAKALTVMVRDSGLCWPLQMVLAREAGLGNVVPYPEGATEVEL